MSHTLLILKNCTNFKDVQMMLKRFFDISTGFRFPKVLCGSVPSIPVLSCPWLDTRLYYKLHFLSKYISTRRPVPSTDQAIPSCFYFRISWILMEQCCFYFFCPLGFLQGLRSLKHWLLQKLSMKNLDQKFKFLIKK